MGWSCGKGWWGRRGGREAREQAVAVGGRGSVLNGPGRCCGTGLKVVLSEGQGGRVFIHLLPGVTGGRLRLGTFDAGRLCSVLRGCWARPPLGPEVALGPRCGDWHGLAGDAEGSGDGVCTDSHVPSPTPPSLGTVLSAQHQSNPSCYLSFHPAMLPHGACLSSGCVLISFSLYEPLFIYFLNNQHF